jgi:AraC-like DNA-binding protein
MVSIDAPWHYHPEFELTYISKGNGKRFVGDSVENFEEGDLILLGSNLPHFWRCDDDFSQNEENIPAEWLVIQFPVEFVNNVIKNIPELYHINSMILRAERGINFGKSVSKLVGRKMAEMTNVSSIQSFFAFLALLDMLATDDEARLLAGENYQISTNPAETDRMKRILEFTVENFQREIAIEQVAEVAHLTTSAFCRYFKQRTRKSYIDYLNEFRISHARKLLIDSDLGVGQIGFECGFNNLSNFHRLFKRQTGLSPMQYARLYKKG